LQVRKPARPAISAIRAARASSGTPPSTIARTITDRTVSSPGYSEICCTRLSRTPLRIATSPSSGVTRPSSIASSVDLPEPFGPTMPMRSPSFTMNEISRKSGVAPKRLANFFALMIGGKEGLATNDALPE